MRAATARAELPLRHAPAFAAPRAMRASAAVPYRPRAARALAIATTVAFHAALLAVLWQLARVSDAVPPPLRVAATIITLPHTPSPQPRVQSVPKPRTKPERPVLPALQPPMPLVQPASAFTPMVDAAGSATPIVSATPEAAPAIAAAPLEAPPAVVAAPIGAPLAPVTTPPRFDAAYLRNPAPEYPAFSRRRGEQGRVLLRVHVARDGVPGEVEINTSSGSDRLDRAALDAVRRWKFVPARLGDTPVDAWVLVPIAFSLDH